MRLKIQITRRLFGDARKNRTGDGAAVVLLGVGLRVVQNDEPDELRIFRRQITTERDNFFALFVSAMWSDFLGGPSFAGDGESGNGGSGGGSAIADDAAECAPNLIRGLW